jgi:hypothetical protein
MWAIRGKSGRGPSWSSPRPSSRRNDHSTVVAGRRRHDHLGCRHAGKLPNCMSGRDKPDKGHPRWSTQAADTKYLKSCSAIRPHLPRHGHRGRTILWRADSVVHTGCRRVTVNDAAGRELWIGDGFAHRAHSRGRYVACLQKLLPFVRSARQHDLR